jgi:hypothetical protein
MNRNLQIFSLNMTPALGGKKSPGSMAGAKGLFDEINHRTRSREFQYQ